MDMVILTILSEDNTNANFAEDHQYADVNPLDYDKFEAVVGDELFDLLENTKNIGVVRNFQSMTQ